MPIFSAPATTTTTNTTTTITSMESMVSHCQTMCTMELTMHQLAICTSSGCSKIAKHGRREPHNDMYADLILPWNPGIQSIVGSGYRLQVIYVITVTLFDHLHSCGFFFFPHDCTTATKLMIPWDPGESEKSMQFTAIILVGTVGQIISELFSSPMITEMARCSTEKKIPQSDVSPMPSAIDCLYPMVNICTRFVSSNMRASSPVQTITGHQSRRVQTKGFNIALVLPWDPGVQSIVCTNCTTYATASYLPRKHTPAQNMSTVQFSRREGTMGEYEDTKEMIPISLIDLLDITSSHQDCLAHEDLFHLKQRVFPKWPTDLISMGTINVILVAAVSQASQQSNLSARRIVAFELLEQEQVCLEKILECFFSIINSPGVQWCSCIFIYWMKPTLQWGLRIFQTTDGCSRIKNLLTINWRCNISLFLHDFNSEVVEYGFQFMSSCRANNTSTSIEPARQESKLNVVSRQELENIVVTVKGPYYTNSNPTGCGLFWEANSSFSTLRQSVSYIWGYKQFDPGDPPLASLFNMAMQSGECYTAVKQRKCPKLKHLEITC